MTAAAVVVPFRPLDELDRHTLEAIVRVSLLATATATHRLGLLSYWAEGLTGWAEQLAKAGELMHWADRVRQLSLHCLITRGARP